jgi:hypothetical protein
MFNFPRLAIPLIVIFMIAGAIGFSLAFTYYPKKNVNVNIDGTCFEILGPAFVEYKKLEAERELRVLIHQFNAIEGPDTIIPITYTGTKEEVREFISKYNVRITDNQEIGGEMYYTKNYVGKTIIKGEISKPNLLKVISDLSTTTRDLNENTLYNLGIQANPFLTPEERERISEDATTFMLQGIQKILENREDSIKRAECRSKIQYTETI